MVSSTQPVNTVVCLLENITLMMLTESLHHKLVLWSFNDVAFPRQGRPNDRYQALYDGKCRI